MFAAVAEGLILSACNALVCKSHGALLPPSSSVLPGSDDIITLRTTHAFSARIAANVCIDGNTGSTNDINLELCSFGDETPSMLVGFGPAPTADLGGDFDNRVLTTPLIWEEPEFAMIELTENPVQRLWSDSLGAYGEPVSHATCFQRTLPDTISTGTEVVWKANIRLQWASSAEAALSPFVSVSCFDSGSRTWKLLWERNPSSSEHSLVPYVTLLQHVKSHAQIVPTEK